MNFISMASGIEAASVAFGPLGWTPIAFSEIEPFPCAVLKHHYPDVPNVGDLAAFDWSVYRGKADAVCAGFPCQAFSIAGLGKSLEDNRGNLSLVGVKAIRLIRSRWVLLEQVPGVLSKPDNPFGCILAGLAGADVPLAPGTNDGRWRGSGVVSGSPEAYGLAWRVLDAQHFGVPQRRRRVFVVGYLGDWKPAAEVLFESVGVCGNPPQSGEARQGAAAGAQGGAGADGKPIVMATQQGGAEIMTDKCPTITSAAGMSGNNQPVVLPGQPIAFKIRQGCEGGGKGYLGSEDKAFTISTTEDQHIFTPMSINTKQQAMDINEDMVGTIGASDYKEPQAVLIPYEVGPGLNDKAEVAPTVDTKTKNGPIQNQTGVVIMSERERESRPLLGPESGLQGNGQADEHAGHGGGTHEPGDTFVMAHGQGGAEVLKGKCPTLNCNHEAPILYDDEKNNP